MNGISNKFSDTVFSAAFNNKLVRIAQIVLFVSSAAMAGIVSYAADQHIKWERKHPEKMRQYAKEWIRSITDEVLPIKK